MPHRQVQNFFTYLINVFCNIFLRLYMHRQILKNLSKIQNQAKLYQAKFGRFILLIPLYMSDTYDIHYIKLIHNTK